MNHLLADDSIEMSSLIFTEIKKDVTIFVDFLNWSAGLKLFFIVISDFGQFNSLHAG